MPPSQRDQLVRFARPRPVFTSAEAAAHGIHPSTLARAIANGTVERVSRGKYRFAEAEITEHHGLVLAAASVPTGVVCLTSALAFHEVGTQLPREIWMAVPRTTWKPKVDYPPLRLVYFTGAALTSGVEEHTLEGRHIRVYDIAKTIVDCFNYRTIVGLDVVLEALTDAWRTRRVRMDDISRYARLCGVANVMQPYLEAMVA